MNRTPSFIPATIAIAAFCIGGCDSTKTETGYNPRRVGMNNAELRSLYAPAFSPEARAADQEKKSEPNIRKPGM
jgi:hypothetical protein